MKKLFLWLLPKNLVSRLAGKIASMTRPKWFVSWLIARFARHFKINLEEALLPIEQFDSLQNFFIRKLKDGARPFDSRSDALISPCDGFWGQCGKITNGTALQIKGRTYSVAHLLGDSALAAQFEGGDFCTFYLSPRDYHRFHMPCAGQITEGIYLPGYLWPVNPWAVKNVDELFCVNERIVTVVVPEGQSEVQLAIVAVGATMVGKVRVNYDANLVSNLQGGAKIRRQYQGVNYAKGQEFGRFEFGSTLVCVSKKGFANIDAKEINQSLRLGETIGRMT